MSRDLDHFIDLVIVAGQPGASSGAKAARALAFAVADHLPVLDASARDGLRAFVNLVSVKPSTARDLLPRSYFDDR